MSVVRVGEASSPHVHSRGGGDEQRKFGVSVLGSVVRFRRGVLRRFVRDELSERSGAQEARSKKIDRLVNAGQVSDGRSALCVAGGSPPERRR